MTTAPVEPPVTMVVPVEQVAQTRKASSPLPPKTVTRPVSPLSPTRWEKARGRIRFREYISPPVENIADLPRKPASETWQVLPDEMGNINIGLAGRNKPILVISTCQGELFQQVVIDKTVDNATGHILLMSLLGVGYRIIVDILCAGMDVISDISDISGVPAGESFDTETQWDNRGDIGVVGSHQELAEMTARPESSTPNKNPGII